MNPHHTAIAATLHCLAGCAIGEIAGLVIGTATGLNTSATIALSVTLAFICGYSLSLLPLRQIGIPLSKAVSLVLAADTLSIATMEVVDNTIMAIIPGAMNAGLVNPIFWLGMVVALTAAFFAALPVNRYLLNKGKGHALVPHSAHAGHHHAGISTAVLLTAIGSFIAGGLVVAAIASTSSATQPTHGYGASSASLYDGTNKSG